MSESKPELSQQQMEALFRAGLQSGVGKSQRHESADKHVSGEAVYVDDRLEFPNQLHLVPLLSPHAHADIVHINTEPCYAVPGVVRVMTAEDVPGNLDIAPLTHGDPLMALGRVECFLTKIFDVAKCRFFCREKIRHDGRTDNKTVCFKNNLKIERFSQVKSEQKFIVLLHDCLNIFVGLNFFCTVKN